MSLIGLLSSLTADAAGAHSFSSAAMRATSLSIIRLPAWGEHYLRYAAPASKNQRNATFRGHQMPVTVEHPDYTLNLDRWIRVADCLAGSDSVKRSAFKYLPMLRGQESDLDDYNAYVTRAGFYDAADRVVQALVGAVFRLDPTISVPDRLKPRLKNMNGKGDSIYTWCKHLLRENLTMGRVGVLLDYPGPDPLTGELPQPDPNDEAWNLPYFHIYETISIRNWRTRRINGTERIDQVILFEERDEETPDGFGTQKVGQYRVLELDESGYYNVRLFRATKMDNAVRQNMTSIPPGVGIGPAVAPPAISVGPGSLAPTAAPVTSPSQQTDWEEIWSFQPKLDNGRPINYIPFLFLAPSSISWKVEKPPVLGLVDEVFSHFRTSADLETGRHFTAFPTPYIIGSDEDTPKEWRMGREVWQLPAGCQVGMLEYKGLGLGSLEKAMEQKENHMIHLGARMLEDQRRAAETPEALRLRSASENATLASVTRTTADGIHKALEWACSWIGADPSNVTAELNQDFMDEQIDPNLLRTLMDAVTRGLLPIDDFLYALKRGDIVRPEITVAELRALLEEDRPHLLGTPIPLIPGPTQNAAQPINGTAGVNAVTSSGATGGSAQVGYASSQGGTGGSSAGNAPKSAARPVGKTVASRPVNG
jgi:hypothetical protein